MLAMKTPLLLICCVLGLGTSAQTIVVQPYLQDASPTSMTVMWESSSGTESTVEYGLTPSLGSTASGTAVVGNGASQIHTTVLTGLTSATRYYYRAKTGSAYSTAYWFRTPALPTAEAPTNICAMSDMQQDAGQPNKFWEVVHNGVIELVNDSLGPDLSEEMSMVIIPGDLVENGNVYSQWETTFFDPANPLFSYVPVYPAIGNHENNSATYFKYFTLPANGTPGYVEHWWYKDHSNVRIIGMDSNTPYRIQAQLDWLDGVLATAASDPNIDFVFAQMHHPHHSELWIDGNTDYTGDIITRLENFSTTTGKPSVHFFGHTHAYSRGQSRDHTHLMVNVATAGGNIDYWGEFAQIDYPEYTISQDEYGWVLVQAQAGGDPQFTVKRYSIGDAANPHANTLEDLVTIKKNNNAPFQPQALFPVNGDMVDPDCLVLQADAFFDPDGEGHGSTHWQVSTTCGDWTSPVVDSWKQYQNLYYEQDTQAGDDLTDETVGGLLPNTQYCWRVRYRDKGLGWSAWSAPVTFATGNSGLGPNLLMNAGAESGIANWVQETGVIESLADGECNGTSSHGGTRYFAVGALCVENAYAVAYQDIDVTVHATTIDAGTATSRFGGWFANWQGGDRPEMALQFRDVGNNVIGGTDTIGSFTGTWTNVQLDAPIPTGTRTVRAILMGTRDVGTDNDSYFDDLSVRLNLSGNSCSFPRVSVPLKTFLEGPYVPGTGIMHDSLRVQGIIPLTEPFTAAGFTHAGEGGGETITPSVLQATGLLAIVDWVLVELRDPVDPSIVASTMSCLLQRGGDVVGLDGSSVPRITAEPGEYHVAVRHRNHLGAMTAQPIALANGLGVIDFTDPGLPLFGTDVMRTTNGVRVQWNGNVRPNNKVTYTGTNNDRDPILVRIGGTVATATVNGYYPEDVNLNGTVKYTGVQNDRDPVLQTVGGTVPTATRLEQLP